MKAILAVLLFYYTINCSSSPNQEVSQRSVVGDPETIMYCKNFKYQADCIIAKDVNATLAYFFASKNETQKISISKLDASSMPVTKLNKQEKFDEYMAKIVEVDPKTSQKYFDPTPDEPAKAIAKEPAKEPAKATAKEPAKVLKKPSAQDLAQFIQDEHDGKLQGKSPVEMKNIRLALEAERKRKEKEEEERIALEMREKILSEIAAFPYTIELYCFNNITDEDQNMAVCSTNLKPSMKITIPSENKVYANFTKADFMSGVLTNGNLKLPKDFNLDLIPEGTDNSSLFKIVIRTRVPPWATEAKPKIALGQKFNIYP